MGTGSLTLWRDSSEMNYFTELEGKVVRTEIVQEAQMTKGRNIHVCKWEMGDRLLFWQLVDIVIEVCLTGRIMQPFLFSVSHTHTHPHIFWGRDVWFYFVTQFNSLIFSRRSRLPAMFPQYSGIILEFFSLPSACPITQVILVIL